MASIIKDFFSYSRRERNGVYVLLLILVILTILPYVAAFFYDDSSPEMCGFEEKYADYKHVVQKKEDFLTQVMETDTMYKSQKEEQTKRNLTNFDPNTISEIELKEFGLPQRIIKTIINYRLKGGKFYKKDDLKKIYGLNQSMYNSLEPFITITRPQNKPFKKKNFSHPMIDINKADTSDLLKLKGIGPVFSKRIIKYRNILGGYVNKDQLLEVYGIDTLLYEQIQEKLILNVAAIKRIDINKTNYNQLVKHPYISPQFAKWVINYRSQHGGFVFFEDISNTPTIDKELWKKIKPYLIIK